MLECSRAVFVSAGPRALLTCARICRHEGGELILAALKPQCRAMPQVGGMLMVLDHCETSAAAFEAPSRTARSERRRCGSKPAQPALAIEVRKSGPAMVVSPVGRLNDVGASCLLAQVLEIFERDEFLLVLDCAGMNYVNSSGLRALLVCADAGRQRGGKLVIACLQPECRRVLEMSGFLSIIDYHETCEATVATLAR